MARSNSAIAGLLCLATGFGCSSETSAPSETSVQVDAPPAASPVVDPVGWTRVTSDDGRISFSMPSAPIPVQQSAQGVHGPIQFTVFKAQSGGSTFNLTLTTFTDAAVQNAGGGRAVIEGLAKSLLVIKPGSTQEILRDLPEEGRPAIEYVYRFPAGRTAGGISYPGGYSTQRLRILDRRVVWQFVDVFDDYASANQAKVDKEIEQFFASLTIDAGVSAASGL